MTPIFTTYPPESKVWVFQADRFLNDDELMRINTLCQSFVSQWKAHNIPVIADFKTLEHAFLVFSVNKNGEQTSGCSIDTLLHFIKELESRFQVSLTNRFIIAYRKTKESPIELYKHTHLIDLFTQNNQTLEGFIYNNALSTIQDLQGSWLIPIEKSWLAAFLPEHHTR